MLAGALVLGSYPRPQAGTACPSGRSTFVCSVVDGAVLSLASRLTGVAEPLPPAAQPLAPFGVGVVDGATLACGYPCASGRTPTPGWPHRNPEGWWLRPIPGRGWAACVSRAHHGLGHDEVRMRGCQTLKPKLTVSGVPPTRPVPPCVAGTSLGVCPVGYVGDSVMSKCQTLARWILGEPCGVVGEPQENPTVCAVSS